MSEPPVSHRVVTQEDVARRAGVTRSIVSYAINNGPRKVSEETRNRVLEAIRELGYRPNKHAQMLSSADGTIAQKYIGIILASHLMFRRPFYGEILASIHDYAHERDRHIRFIRVFDDFNNPALFNELIHPNEISGIVLIDLAQVLRTDADRTLVEKIVERVERVVCVEWEWQGVPSVRFDRQNAMYKAAQHLLSLNRRRIAYIGPEDKRLAGYQQALWEHGITPDVALVQYGVNPDEGCLACERLIESGVSFDAVCVGTDESAVGVLKCLNNHGLVVPRDVMVVGVDNLEITEFLIPSLTTVDVPKREIGFHVIEILLSDAPSDSAFTITLPTKLIVRESTSES